MWGPPTESEAIRREYGFGCLAFVLGFVAIAAGTIYLHVRYVIPQDGWWGIGGCIRILLEYPLLAGVGLMWVTMTLLNRRHRSLGVYLCGRCGRPLPARGYCPCVPEEFRRVRRKGSKWRHHRRRILPVLGLYAALLVPALGLAVLIEPTHSRRFLVALVGAHWLICFFVVGAVDVSLEIAKSFGRVKRFRTRWKLFRQVFVAYPLALGLTAAAIGIIKAASS